MKVQMRPTSNQACELYALVEVSCNVMELITRLIQTQILTKSLYNFIGLNPLEIP